MFEIVYSWSQPWAWQIKLKLLEQQTEAELNWFELGLWDRVDVWFGTRWEGDSTQHYFFYQNWTAKIAAHKKRYEVMSQVQQCLALPDNFAPVLRFSVRRQ